ncbi:uncharacterized protein LOC110606350 [Manihot esculenta]|nr:uncharacterized protein LOC110606350 [Manihot esculenta]
MTGSHTSLPCILAMTCALPLLDIPIDDSLNFSFPTFPRLLCSLFRLPSATLTLVDFGPTKSKEMGTCFSCSVFSESQLLPPTAKVVSVNGNLQEYNVPVFVSQVINCEAASSSSSSSSSPSLFLCNSDFLSYDDYIPVLDSNAQLKANQLYFVLPRSKLQNRLNASDMAALAVKASIAIQNASKKDAYRRKKARISPVLLGNQSLASSYDAHVIKSFEKPQAPQQSPVGFSRSGSVGRLRKYTSRRAKLAVRSFKLRLSTIYEGTVL